MPDTSLDETECQGSIPWALIVVVVVVLTVLLWIIYSLFGMLTPTTHTALLRCIATTTGTIKPDGAEKGRRYMEPPNCDFAGSSIPKRFLRANALGSIMVKASPIFNAFAEESGIAAGEAFVCDAQWTTGRAPYGMFTLPAMFFELKICQREAPRPANGPLGPAYRQ